MAGNFRFKRTLSIFLVIGLVFLLSALTTALVLAQGDSGENEGQVASAPEADVENYIPVQGRLSDAAGNPLNGTYDMTFRLYAEPSGGTELCSDTNSNVSVSNGLFNTQIWGNCAGSITGDQLYLGIEIEADGEMSPRQAIYAVPYAWSLRPGAVISGTVNSGPIVHIENSSPTGRGLRSYAVSTTGLNYGIVGASKSPDGYAGYFYNNGGGIGLWGWSNASEHPAIFGCISASSGSCDAGTNPAGVIGQSSSGDGVQGLSSSVSGRGVYAGNTGGGSALTAYSSAPGGTNHLYPTMYLIQGDVAGDFVVGASSLYGTRYWRVDRTGKGYFNGGTQNSGADFAEQIDVVGDEAKYEPGDVLVISTSTDRAVELSNGAYSTAVIGVYSTDPAVLAGAPDTGEALGGVPVAIVGIVPCKVSAENGAIQRGDLLVTADLPGHAMRAGENPPQGTVVGKALQPLDNGTGVILILVILQ